MIDKLFELKELKKYVSLYTNEEDTSKFIFGKIMYVNTDYVVIYMIAPDGNYDGILVKDIDSVMRIEFDDIYSEKMIKLIDESRLPKFDLLIENKGILISILKKFKDEHKILSIELLHSESDDVVGFVESIDEKSCMIKQVDLYGHENGFSYVFLNDITQISYDSNDEQIILKLWKKLIMLK